MNKLLKLDNIMYKVSDLDKAVKLYIDVFGLKQLWRDDKAKMVGLGMEDKNYDIITDKVVSSFMVIKYDSS